VDNSVNNGDTGTIPKVSYTAAADVIKDLTNVSMVNFAAVNATDGASPFITNGLQAASYGTNAFANIITMDTDAVTYGYDINTGDGYIDKLHVKFSETIKFAGVDTSTIAVAFLVDNGDGWSTITMSGIDADMDGDVDADDVTAAKAGVNNFYLVGTSGKLKDKWDTGRTPTLEYAGGVDIVDVAGVQMAAFGDQPSYDGSAPVPALGVGGVDTNEIQVTWSEPVYRDNAGAAFAAGDKGSDIFGYADGNATGVSALAIVDLSMTGNVMTITTDGVLSLADVESDSIWVKASKVFDNADNPHTGGGGTEVDMTDNAAEDNAVGTGYKIIINDIIAPWITAAMTVDADGDGLIDHIRFMFSELIEIESVDGYVSLNALGADVSATWQLQDYAGTAKWNLFQNNDAGKVAANAADEPVFTDSQVNDAAQFVLYLRLDEDLVPVSLSGSGSTDFAPVMTIIDTGADAVTLSDNKPNVLDVNSGKTGAINTGDIAKDAVGPVLMSAAYNSGTTLNATFSEDIKLSSVVKEDFMWVLSTDGDQSAPIGYAQNVVRITEPSVGVAMLEVTDDYDWLDDMSGTLKTIATITDNADALGTNGADNAGAIS